MIAALALAALQVADSAPGAPGAPGAGVPERTPYWVSSRTGSDAEGDGGETRPFRSLTRALEAARAAGAVPDLRVDLGEYSTAHGEVFPLRLPLGTRLRGLTAEYTALRATGEAIAIQVEGEGRGGPATVLDSLQVAGAGAGVVANARRRLVLSNLLVRECDDGIRFDGSFGSKELRLESTRVEQCGTGLRATGGREPARITIRGCSFADSTTGAHLISAAHVEGFALAVHDSVFRDLETGVLREGGPSHGGDAFEDCTFQRNGVGIEFRLAEGDRGVAVRRCRFLENEVFGLRLVGRDGSRGLRTTILDSELRWNGVGVHLVNLLHPVEIARCRIADNVGNGVFVSCYPSASGAAQAIVRDCLISDNGACGIQTHADGKALRAAIAGCTIANNATAGVARVNKHEGESTVTLERCILAGPAPATDNLPAEALTDCWRGADPGFLDPSVRDYRLAKRSPAAALGAPPALLVRGPG